MGNFLCNVIVLYGMMMEGREKLKPGAGSQPSLLEKHQGGPPGLTSPSDGRIAINCAICHLDIVRKGLEFNLGL